jgi:hypothetical protein
MQDVGNMPKGATLEDMWREIGLWYDGYSWDGKTRLYNPYSLINLFLGDSFEPFWMNLDPSAKMLSEILANDPLAVTRDRFKDISTEQIGLAEVGSLGPVPALFQTGMLTIDKNLRWSPFVGAFFALFSERPHTICRTNLSHLARGNFGLMLSIFRMDLGGKD